jgi:hypothetical protein
MKTWGIKWSVIRLANQREKHSRRWRLDNINFVWAHIHLNVPEQINSTFKYILYQGNFSHNFFERIWNFVAKIIFLTNNFWEQCCRYQSQFLRVEIKAKNQNYQLSDKSIAKILKNFDYRFCLKNRKSRKK